MKLKHIKKILDKLSSEQLEQDLLYKSDDLSISGIVSKFSKSKEDLYTLHDEDPSPLYTKKQLKEDHSMDNEEIEECDIEVPKGSFFIEF